MSLCTLPPNNHGHRQDGRGLIALRVSNTERHFFTADEEASLQDFDDGSHRRDACGIDEVEVVMAWRAYIAIGRRGDPISARHFHHSREFIIEISISNGTPSDLDGPKNQAPEAFPWPTGKAVPH